MIRLPDRVVIVGSGGGALTIAADLGLAGVEVTLADQPRFSADVEAVAAARGVRVMFDDMGEERLASVAGTSLDPAAAIKGAALVIVSVPSFGHRPVAELIASELEDGQTILWVGEGGGSFTTVAAIRSAGRRPTIRLGDTNSLPYGGARLTGPGRVRALRKTGGTYLAGLPTAITTDLNVPHSLVLASSLAREVGVEVPVIEGLISLASAAANRDFRGEGRTLADWGLAGAGREGLLAAADQGWW